MDSSITRFDIEKLDWNIVQNLGGSKQVGLKQLGSKLLGIKGLLQIYSMAGSDDEIPPPPPPQTPTQQAPHTVSTIKLFILKKGEYGIWPMKMEHYLSHTDYHIWEVIQKGNGPINVSIDTNGVIKVLPPKTAKEILARERERKARTTLLIALPEDHLEKFHKMIDAKDMWDAIKSRFGGNDESKKMQKYILKKQFEGFSVSNSEGLHKGYDRSLPSSWSQVSLVTRTKPGVDSLSFDDLYNNLRVFEFDVKGSIGSSSSAQNVAFVSSESTSSTNDVSTAYGVSTSSGYNSQRENSSSYTDELMYSFFANQSSGPHLDHEDLEQLDEFDLEEMDLKWQVAMISMRLKKFYKKTGRKLHFDAKEPVGFDKTKVECYNCHKKGHFARECRSKGNTGYKSKDNGRRPGKQEEPKALVTLDGEGVDWTDHAEDEQENFALMAYSNSGSDTEVTSCSKECVESYAKLKKLYDEQREQLGDASIEIQAYTQALKKVEAQLVTHQKNQLWYEEKIRFMKIDLDDKTDVLTYHKKLLAEAVKEKEELKTKLENFQSSSKGLSKLLNSQMSKRDKSGLGYGDQVHNGVLSYENEVLQSVFDSRSSDVEDSPMHDRFANIEGMHVVPPPMTGNYMPSGPDREVDDSMFTYGPKQSKTSESDTQTIEPKVVSQPKVWPDAPIIEEYKSDSDDEYVIQPSKEQERPSFAFIPRETVKEENTYSPSPKANKRDWNGLMSKRLGLVYWFTKKACFVCGSFSHLIKDCDFHEKRMAKQVELNKKKGKGIGQGENRLVWNNVQRLNHQNQFVPIAILTRTSRIPVNTARQNLSSQAATTSTARKVNTARPIVNEIRPRNNFYKSHSPIRRPFNRTTTPRTSFLNHKVNTAGVKVVSVVGGIRETAVQEEPNHVRYNNNIDARIDMEADPAQDTLLLQYVLLILQNSQARSNRMKGEMLINDTGLMINLKLRKEFAQEAEDLLLQAGAARATSTNTVNTVRTPVSTASSSGGPSYPDLTNYADQDNSQIPALQDIYGNSNDGIFTNASYDDEGAVADFTNLESTMNIRCGRESAFLYGTIDEEVYVSQPPGFVDPKFLKKVYKVEKALYGLHQAPRAWSWCDEFEALMKSRFQMSSIGELTFFLGLQVKQKEDGIFISHDKYVAEILKKFDFDSVKTASTPIETQKPLTKDEEVVDMDVHLYRSMTGSLMYLIASRPDIMFAVCACSRFQETHNRRLSNSWQETYSMAMQEADNFGSNSTNEAEIKSLLLPTCWGQAKLVLSGNVGAARHKVSVARQKFVLLVTITTVVNDEKQIHATVDSKAVVVTEASIRSSLLLNDVVGTACLTNEAIFQNLALMGYEGELNKLTFQKALFSPQWKYLIHTILHCLSSKSTSWNEFSTNIASAVICLATNQKFNFSKLIFDGMLRNLDNPKKKFLMYPRFLMVFLNNQIELGEPFNDVYITPAHTLKVFSNMSRKGVKFSGKVTPLFDSMLVPHQAPEGEGSEQPTEPQPTPSPTQPSTGDQPPVTDSSSVYDTTQDSRDSLEGTNGSEGDQVQPSHDSNHLGGPTSDRAKGGMTLEELFVLCTNLSNKVLALEASKDAQAAQIIKLKTRLKKLKKKSHPGRRNAKTEPTLDDSTFDDLDADHEVLEKGGSNEEPVSVAGNTGVSTAVPEVSTATPMTPPTTTSVFEDKYIFLADALVMLSDKTKLKVVAIKEVKESDMTKRSILTLKPLPSIDPKDKDAKVARLVYEEELAELEKEKEEKHRQKQASVDYIANLKKQLAVERSATIRNKPPTRTQLRSLMMTYLKHTDSDLEEEEQLKAFLMIVLDEKGEINYEVLDKRYPIVNWESKFYHTDRYGKPHDYYRVFRADGSSRYIKTFTEMVSRFDRLDFIKLHSLVMKRFETSTLEGIDLILWGSLRTMFEANAEDDLWKNQEEWILKIWNFYDNCGVHILVLEDGTEFYMLAERRFIQKQIDESRSHDGSEKNL
ncbi:ribonuclease H-like domain-containing protein [Tanacetum coccineum]